MVETSFFQNRAAAAAAVNWVRYTGGAHSLLHPLFSISFLLSHFLPGTSLLAFMVGLFSSHRGLDPSGLGQISASLALCCCGSTSSNGAVLEPPELGMGLSDVPQTSSCTKLSCKMHSWTSYGHHRASTTKAKAPQPQWASQHISKQASKESYL